MSWILSPIIQAKKQIKQILQILSYDSVTGTVSDYEGNPVLVTNQVFATVAAMLAETPATSTVSLISPAAFTGTGKPTVGVPVIYNGTEWEPLGGRQKLFKVMFGTQAVPTETVSSATKFSLATDIIIPGGLLSTNGHSLEIIARGQKHGATATATLRIWLGTSATYTNNSFLFAWASGSTDGAALSTYTEAVRTTQTTVFSTTNIGFNQNSTTGILADKNTLIDFNVDQYLVPAMHALTAPDTFDLIQLEVFWKSGVMG